MKVIELYGQELNINEPICSAIGFFDGLHIGHMALVNEVLEVSQKKGYKSALMTFDHHPLYVLGKIDEERYLSSMDDRIKILENLGLDYLFIIHFTRDVASLLPEQFIQNYIISSSIQHVVCGFDFRFGQMNKGDIHTLQAFDEFDVTVIDEVLYKNEKISSTRIRHLLQSGELEDVHCLLGYYYRIRGEVIRGRRIGHSLGFPTANIDYQSYYLPSNGVYGVKVYIDGRVYDGMCNIGYNPTFTALRNKSVEVHIFDFDEDIYGVHIDIEFYIKIRDEQPFSSKDELIHQLQHDKNQLKEYFKR